MLHFKQTTIAISMTVITSLFSGCGDSSSDTSSSSNDTVVQGQLADSYVSGAKYRCANGKEGVTDLNGTFSCESLPVSFSLGTIKLGEVATLPQDKHVFPQDLLGVDRDDTNNSEVVAMAQLLQSFDTDHDPENGIEIDHDATEEISIEEDFDEHNLNTYITNANLEPVSNDDARKHLEKTTHTVETISHSELPEKIKGTLNTPLSTLTDEVKNHIAYMGNEERLAYDVYNKLSLSFPEEKTLINIPQKSEIQHIETVKALVVKYSLESELLSVRDVTQTSLSADADINNVAGVYDIAKIQDLYNQLIEKGEKSSIDALQVGCMVEVTDVNDLEEALIAAEDSNASDVLAAFTFLRDASYSHYWSFDKSLKNAGVTDGCCSAGEAYCKTEAQYPIAERDSAASAENGGEHKQQGDADGSGEQRRKGKL